MKITRSYWEQVAEEGDRRLTYQVSKRIKRKKKKPMDSLKLNSDGKKQETLE
jgi:hypothetical protein